MVEMELVISSKFKQLLPGLSEEEAKQLEENIVNDGRVRDPILYWHHGGKNLVVDGMNRYGIAKRTGMPYRTEPKEFANVDEAELWILNNALGRRNLMKPHEVRKVRGELYNRLKNGHGGDRKSGDSKNQTDIVSRTSGGVATKVAELAGVAERTVERDGKYVESLNKLSSPVKKAVEEDRLKVTDAQIHALAKLDATAQQAVARDVRTGTKVEAALTNAGATIKGPKGTTKPKADEKTGECEVSKGKHEWVSDGSGGRYCEHCKEDHPENEKPKKSGKEVVSAAKLVDEMTRQHVGKLVRGIDAIAKANGGKGAIHKEADAALNTLIGCLKKMRAGEK